MFSGLETTADGSEGFPEEEVTEAQLEKRAVEIEDSRAALVAVSAVGRDQDVLHDDEELVGWHDGAHGLHGLEYVRLFHARQSKVSVVVLAWVLAEQGDAVALAHVRGARPKNGKEKW